MTWEFEFLYWIIDIRNDFLTSINKVLTYLGEKGIFWILFCAVLIAIPKTRKIGIYAGIALGIQVILGEGLIKHIIQRERPFVSDPAIDTIISAPIGKYSMPSGHSSSSMAVAVSVFIQNKKLGIFVLITALMIMLSRLYFCVHYPTDIIAGALLGLTVAIVVYYTSEHILKKHKEHKRDNT